PGSAAARPSPDGPAPVRASAPPASGRTWTQSSAAGSAAAGGLLLRRNSPRRFGSFGSGAVGGTASKSDVALSLGAAAGSPGGTGGGGVQTGGAGRRSGVSSPGRTDPPAGCARQPAADGSAVSC